MSTWRVVLILGAAAAALVVVSAEGLRAYGAMLFAATPFLIGYAGGAIAHSNEMGAWFGFALGQLALIAASAFLLLWAIEGAICLVMAWPLAAAMAALGNWVAYAWRQAKSAHVRISCSALALLPIAMFAEREALPEPPLRHVSSVIEIGAPPESVWPNVVAFAKLPPAKETIFRLGLAHPIRAEIEGSGVGAVRRCVFSTGAFVEPITVWDEPRRLAFTVEENPPPMTELSPYGSIHPPHLDGYFWSERGQFELEPLPGGGTRLIGTTWYRQRLWPTAYWLLWSDYVIHKIHLRVLRHIEARSLGGPALVSSSEPERYGSIQSPLRSPSPGR